MVFSLLCGVFGFENELFYGCIWGCGCWMFCWVVGVNIRIPKAYENGEKVLTLKKSNGRVLNPYGGIIIKK